MQKKKSYSLSKIIAVAVNLVAKIKSNKYYWMLNFDITKYNAIA